MKTILVDNRPAPEPENDEVKNAQAQASDNLDALEESIRLPEKYKGKSAEDIAQMHMEAEKEKSRLGAELGTLRKLTDDIIRRKLVDGGQEAAGGPKARKELTTDDLLESPQKAIDEAIASHPAVQRAEQAQLDLLEQQVAAQLGAFAQKHPDYKEIGESPEFISWVKATPGRQKLYVQASQYDFDVADELLNQFKEAQGKARTAATKQLQKVDIKTKLKDATLETATTGDSSKKVFRRIDLLDMMIARPDRYWDENFQKDLRLAYQEGRVK